TIDIRLWVENHQIIDLFTDSDVTNGQIKLLRDGNRNAALCGAVEFRQNDAGDIGNLHKLTCLFEAILTRYGVDNKQSFMRSSRYFAACDALHLFELGH